MVKLARGMGVRNSILPGKARLQEKYYILSPPPDKKACTDNSTQGGHHLLRDF